MRKIILLLAFFSFSLAYQASGQTASLPDFQKNTGPVVVPVTVADFINIGAITMFFDYDPAVLVYNGFQNPAYTGMTINSYAVPENSLYRVAITWNASTGGINMDGVLVEIKFFYVGGESSLTFFEEDCDIQDFDFSPVNVSYINGSIGPANPVSINLTHLTGQVPGIINMPLDVDFSVIDIGVSAFNFLIEYNPGVIQYNSLANEQLNDIEISHPAPGRLAILWTNPDLFAPLGSKLNGKLLDIVFNYAGGFTDLVFDVASSSVGDNNMYDVDAVYTNGSVSPFFPATAVLPVMEAIAGYPVNVPLDVTGFDNLGAITFFIGYDNTVLEFVDIVNPNPGLAEGSIGINVTDGIINFAWYISDPAQLAGPDIDGKLFDIQFNMLGGTSELEFMAGCEVSQADLNQTIIPVAYTNGLIIEGTVSLVLSTITANPDEIPICHSSTITVQLKNPLGENLMVGAGTVELFTTLGELSAVTNNNDGTYTASLTSGTPQVSGQATITGTLNGDAFVDQAFVAILPEPMISFGFNGEEAGWNASFSYCYNTPVEVTLFEYYGGTPPYSVTYKINDGDPVTVNNLFMGSVISEAQIYTAGTYNIVLSNITDANGCQASQAFLDLCTASITIWIEPEITCPNEIAVNTDLGSCYASVEFEATVSGEPEPITVIYKIGDDVITSPHDFPVGTTTVDVIAENDCKTVTCSFLVTVEDSEAPTITCIDDIQVNVDDGFCFATIAATALAPASYSDNCPVDEANLSWTMSGALTSNGSGLIPETQFPVGITIVTYTITDGAGLTEVCDFSVIIVDNEAPVLIGDLPEGETDLNLCFANIPDGPAELEIAALYMDNCGIVNVIKSGLPEGDDCSWTITYNYQIYDSNGNYAPDVNITYSGGDISAPVITLPNVAESYNNTSGQCYRTLTLTATASDNCTANPVIRYYIVDGIDEFEITYPYNFPVGITTVKVVATDDCDNSSEDTFVVDVRDTQNPTLPSTNMSAKTRSTNPGVCTYTVAGTEFDPTFPTDNCPGVTLSNNINGQETLVGAVFNRGVTQVVWTATDASNNTATRSFNVTVNDTELPALTCVGDQIRNTDQDLCTYTVVGTEFDPISFSDNCQVVALEYIISGASFGMGSGLNATLEGRVFYPGVTTVKWIVTDASNNKRECIFTVTVNDIQPPDIVCLPSNPILPTDLGTCNYTHQGTAWDATADDNCPADMAPEQTSYLNSLKDFDNAYGYRVTPKGFEWTINEQSLTTNGGNRMRAYFDKTNNTAYVLISNTLAGQLVLSGTSGLGLATAMRNVINSPDVFQVRSGSQVINIYNPDGTRRTQAQIDADAETLASSWLPGLFSRFSVLIGKVEVLTLVGMVNDAPNPHDRSKFEVDHTFRFIDGRAWSRFDAASYYRVDAGVISERTFAQAKQDAKNDLQAAFDDYDPELYSTANWALLVGAKTAGDAAIDAITAAPHACWLQIHNVKNSSLIAMNDLPAGYIYYILSGATTGEGYSLDGVTFNLGETTVTWTAIDANGNISQCSFIVTVEDTQTPTIACADNIQVDVDPGQCYATVDADDLEPASYSDNCPVDETNLIWEMTGALVASGTGLIPQTQFPVGTTIVTYTITDGANLTAQCSFEVEVTDNIPPTIAFVDNIEVNVDSGQCYATVDADDLEPTSYSDNCPVDETNLSWEMTGALVASGTGLIPQTLFPVGATNITYTITDGAGLSAECSFDVEVIDNIPPTIVCVDDIQVNVDAGQCYASIDADDLEPASYSDNCPVDETNLSWEMTGALVASGTGLIPQTLFPVGATNITYTITDGAGLSSECSFDVEVIDNIPPTITCVNNIQVNVDPGQCNATVDADYLEPASYSDNCPVDETNLSWEMTGALVASGSGLIPQTLFPVGATNITYTITDGAGLSAECSFDVEVIDNVPPTIACIEDIVRSTDFGSCEWLSQPGDLTLMNVADNCGIASVEWQIQFPVLGSATDELIALWNFEDAAKRPSNLPYTADDGTAANKDVAPISLTGPAFTGWVNGSGGTGTFAPNSNNWHNPIDNYWGIIINTLGFENLKLSSKQQGSNTGPRDFAIDYSLNGTDWTRVAGSEIIVANNFTLGVLNELSLPEACDNQPAVYLRWIKTSNEPVNSGSTFGSGGTNRIDDIIIIGTTSGDIISGTDDASGVSFPVGVSKVTYTVTDESGNTSICSFTVTVEDDESPAIIDCPGDQIVNTDVGECSYTHSGTAWNAAATDNCTPDDEINISSMLTGATVSGPHISLDGVIFNLGETIVTWTAIDAIGNVSETCSFIVRVEDNEEPAIACVDDILVNVDAGQCYATLAAVVLAPASFGDNCYVDENNLSWTMTGAIINSGDGLIPETQFPVGTTMVTYTITDGAGLTDECSFEVEVNDNIPPTIVCVDNIEVNVDAGQCHAIVAAIDLAPASYGDNCPVDENHLSWEMTGEIEDSGTGLIPETQFPVGTTIVTYTITDAAGLTDDCSFEVEVTDNIPPTIVCVDNIEVNVDAGQCHAIVAAIDLAPASYGDNCPVDENHLSWEMTGAIEASGSGLIPETQFPVGITIVTYIITDATGLTDDCSFEVEVTDNIPPTIVCLDNIEVNVDAGQCHATVAAIDLTPVSYSDNCPVDETNLSWTMAGALITSGSGLIPETQFPIGTTIVTYTITDAAGLTDDCSFEVEVTDNIPPTIVCLDNIEVNVDAGQCHATVAAIDLAPVSYSDNCPVDETNLSWEMTGAIEASGFGLVPETQFPVGTTIVTYTITDGAGHTEDCSFEVEVTDNIPPTIVCFDNIEVNVDAGQCHATVAAIALAPVSYDDNCYVDETNLSWEMTGAIEASGFGLIPEMQFPVGTTIVTYTITDVAGLTDDCSFEVTVLDNEAPVFANCPPDQTVNASALSCSEIISWFAPTVTDNCGLSSVSLTTVPYTSLITIGNLTFGLFDVGVTQVAYTATDIYGNVSTCEFTIEVKDITPPIITGCPGPVIEANNDPGTCSAVVIWTVPTASDNCSGVSFSTTHNPGEKFPVGTTTVTYTATDVSGNVSTCSFDVVVTDIENPVITCPVVEDVYVVDFGEITATLSFEANAVDNCSIDKIEYFIDDVLITFPYQFPIGLTSVNAIATDFSGLTDECNFIVNVQDSDWLWTNSAGTRQWHDAANWNRLSVPYAGSGFKIIINESVAFEGIGPVISTEETFGSDDEIILIGDVRITLSPQGRLTTENLEISMATHAEGHLLILSDENSTGSLINSNEDVLAMVERFITGAENSWHQLSSPVKSQDIDPDFLDGAFLAWSEPAQTFVNFNNTYVWPTWHYVNNGLNSFVPGKGYLVAYPFDELGNNLTKVFNGELNQGEYSFVLHRKAHPEDTFEGFNLLGNPYPSSIDWKAENGWSGRENLQTPDTTISPPGYNYWVWNDEVGNYGAYNTLAIGDIGTNNTTRYISPMQGFWVRAEIDESILSIDDNTRVHSDQQWIKHTDLIAGVIRITVSGEANRYSDEVILEFGHKSDLGGAEKMFGMYPQAPSIYTTKHNQNFSINFLTTVSEHPTVSVSFDAGVSSLYSITAHGVENFDNVLLEDKQTGQFHNLTKFNSYHFNANADDDPNRFIIHFETVGAGVLENEQAIIYYANEHLNVFNPWNRGLQMQLMDASGRIIAEYSDVSVGHNEYYIKPQPGIYYVKYFNESRVAIKKILIMH